MRLRAKRAPWARSACPPYPSVWLISSPVAAGDIASAQLSARVKRPGLIVAGLDPVSLSSLIVARLHWELVHRGANTAVAVAEACRVLKAAAAHEVQADVPQSSPSSFGLLVERHGHSQDQLSLLSLALVRSRRARLIGSDNDDKLSAAVSGRGLPTAARCSWALIPDPRRPTSLSRRHYPRHLPRKSMDQDGDRYENPFSTWICPQKLYLHSAGLREPANQDFYHMPRFTPGEMAVRVRANSPAPHQPTRSS